MHNMEEWLMTALFLAAGAKHALSLICMCN